MIITKQCKECFQDNYFIYKNLFQKMDNSSKYMIVNSHINVTYQLPIPLLHLVQKICIVKYKCKLGFYSFLRKCIVFQLLFGTR